MPTPETVERLHSKGTFPSQKNKACPLCHQVPYLLSHTHLFAQLRKMRHSWKSTGAMGTAPFKGPSLPSAWYRPWSEASFLLPWHLRLPGHAGFRGCHKLPVARNIDVDGGTRCPVPVLGRAGRHRAGGHIRFFQRLFWSWTLEIPVLTLTSFSITHKPSLSPGRATAARQEQKGTPFPLSE